MALVGPLCTEGCVAYLEGVQPPWRVCGLLGGGVASLEGVMPH